MTQKNGEFQNKKTRVYPEPVLGLDYSTEMPMDMEELLSRLPKFRESDIKFFISKGVIRKFPLKVLDFEVLKRLHIIWATENIVSINAKRIGKKGREKVLEKVKIGVQTKLETWIYSRIIKTKESGKKVYKRQIVIEAIKRFRLKNTKKQQQEIEEIVKKIITKMKFLRKQKLEKINKDETKIGEDK